MNKEQRNEVYDRAIKTWGEISQFDQCLEEMAELMIAINKYKRMNYNGEDLPREQVIDNLYEEMADTLMCIECIEHLLKEEKSLNEVLDKKINKCLTQINKQCNK